MSPPVPAALTLALALLAAAAWAQPDERGLELVIRPFATIPALAAPIGADRPPAAPVGRAWPTAGSPPRRSIRDPHGAASVDERQATTPPLEMVVQPLADDAVALLGWRRARERGPGTGTRGLGPLAARAVARSTSTSLVWSPADGWALGARLSSGRSAAPSPAWPPAGEAGAPPARGWSIAAAGADRWHDGDRLSIRVTQPLAAGPGSQPFAADPAQSEDGIRPPRWIPGRTGTERRLALGYGFPLDIGGSGGGRITGWLDLSLVLRVQPDHRADAPVEPAAMLRWRSAF